MSGDYQTSIHYDIRELAERLALLESKVAQSNLLMRRPGSENYEKLVDVVCDHEERLIKEEQELQKCAETVSELSENDDANW